MQDDSLNQQETLERLAEAVAALAEAGADSGASGGFLIFGQLSFGALLGALAVLFIRRLLQKKDESEQIKHNRREVAIDLHQRFNSAEMMKARTDAEAFLIDHTGQPYRELRGKGDGLNAVWIVAREYEFMFIAIDEELANSDVIAKYAFEIFVYWLQHFRFFFRDEGFETVKRIKALEDFFKAHSDTAKEWSKMEQTQRAHINNLRQVAGKEEFDFSEAPELLSNLTKPESGQDEPG